MDDNLLSESSLFFLEFVEHICLFACYAGSSFRDAVNLLSTIVWTSNIYLDYLLPCVDGTARFVTGYNLALVLMRHEAF